MSITNDNIFNNPDFSFADGITGTTAYFSGGVTAAAFYGGSGSFPNGISGSTAYFTGGITAAAFDIIGGFTGTTATFSGLTVTGGLTGNTGFFNGLTAGQIFSSGAIIGNSTVLTNLNVTGGFTGNTGYFVGMTITGLTGNTATFNGLTGTTATFGGVTITGGLTGNTGYFGGLLALSTATCSSATITGMTGGTATFNGLTILNGMTGNTGYFGGLLVLNTVTAAGMTCTGATFGTINTNGITGTTATFGGVTITSGLTGVTATFSGSLTHAGNIDSKEYWVQIYDYSGAHSVTGGVTTLLNLNNGSTYATFSNSWGTTSVQPFTVPVTGVYSLSANIYTFPPGGTNEFTWFSINDSSPGTTSFYYGMHRAFDSTGSQDINMVPRCTLKLNANDAVRIYGYCTSTTNFGSGNTYQANQVYISLIQRTA